MHNSLWGTSTISYTGCAAQLFFFMFFISAELSLLTIMCYDCYVSICKPLHYGTFLGSRACAHMAAAAWASAFLNALLHTANTFSLPLCHGNALGQFFCEIPHILKLSCSKSYLRELGLIGVSACLAFGCFVFIVFSYVQIFRAVLRIPSEQGRHKAFSTCLPHLAVVSLFLSTAAFSYLKPPSMSSPSLDLLVSVLYSVVPPALNPLIYKYLWMSCTSGKRTSFLVSQTFPEEEQGSSSCPEESYSGEEKTPPDQDTDLEFKLWEVAWKQLLKEALPDLHADPNTAKDASGVTITIEHLSGFSKAF
ncbi:olfactory receptor 14J1-like [Anomalospiza imberbis]|uniref:olfactory receptor 14J1-like n=1 Tax=Anomalospiza imberbis TaxID=187417 RepID=UPI00358EFD37